MGATRGDKVILRTLDLQLIMATDHQVFHRHRLDGVNAGQGFDNEIIAPLVGLTAFIKRATQPPPQDHRGQHEGKQNAQRYQHELATDNGNQTKEQDNERQIDHRPDCLPGIKVTQDIQTVQPLKMQARCGFFVIGKTCRQQMTDSSLRTFMFELCRRQRRYVGPTKAQSRFKHQRAKNPEYKQGQSRDGIMGQHTVIDLQQGHRQCQRQQVDHKCCEQYGKTACPQM